MSTLGRGRAGLVKKSSNYLNLLRMEAPTPEAFRIRCEEVVAIVADQGTEKGVADVSTLQGSDMADADNPDCLRAFPNAFWMPEHLHIFNNALEHAITSLLVWQKFLQMLRAVERFLQDYSLRTLFRAACLANLPRVSELFENFSGSHVEWRWEYLEKTLDKLVPLLPHMAAHLDTDAMLHSDEGNLDPTIVKEARAALDLPFFAEFCELVRSIGKCIYVFTHLLEGCVCHSHVWTGLGTFRAKARKMVALTGYKSCFWKGRTGPWLQCVGLPHLCDMIRNSTTDRLQSFLSAMDASRRAAFVNVENLAKTSLIDELTQKLAFHSESPYNCMGMFWGEYPGGDEVVAKTIAKKNIAEYDSCMAGPQRDKVHRVAHRLYSPDGDVRRELQSWAEGEGRSLKKFPTAYAALLRYALVPLCGRSAEGLHARLNRIRRRSTYMKAPAIAASLRLEEHVQLLSTSTEYFKFCQKHWRSKKLLDDTLKLRLSAGELRELTRHEKISRIYQCSLADEHRDMSFERGQQEHFLALTAHCRQDRQRSLGLVENQVVLFVKAKLVMKSTLVYSLPKAIFDEMLEAGASTSDEARAELPRDIVEQIVAVIGNEERFDMEGLPTTAFFSVINIVPEKRYAVPLHHKKPMAPCIHVVERSVLGSSAADASVTLSGTPTSSKLGLAPFVAHIVAYLPKLYQWTVVGHEAMLAGRMPQLAFGSAPRPLALLDAAPEAPAAALLPIEDVLADDDASRVLTLVARQCSARPTGWLDYTDVRDVALATVDALVISGYLEMQNDDLMIAQVRPAAAGTKWASSLACKRPLQAMLVDTCAQTSKLDMVVWLTRHGWTPADSPAPLVLDGPKEFVVEMRRPASYYMVLLKFDNVMRKGVESLPHDGVDGFYRCLLQLNGEQLECVLRVGNEADEYYRKELRAALAPREGRNALDDEHVEPRESGAIVPVSGALDVSGARAWKRFAMSGGPDSEGEAAPAFKVYFDFQQHSFGQRGFVQCPVAGHGKPCIMHCYTQGFGSRLEFAAALHKWVCMAGKCSTRLEHLSQRPDPTWALPVPESLTLRDF